MQSNKTVLIKRASKEVDELALLAVYSEREAVVIKAMIVDQA